MTSFPGNPGASDAISTSFVDLAISWAKDNSREMLKVVWEGYDRMVSDMPGIDTEDLERSITQALVPKIRSAMSSYEPYDIEHGPYEHETKAPPPAQPPQYDFAFISKADGKFKWPLEAKVLETPGTLAEYQRDLENEFLTCRYAPFSSEGAMVGYLLTGTAAVTLLNIEKKLGCTLDDGAFAPGRPHRTSGHVRSVPNGKPYPPNFKCHHLILEYPQLKRTKPADIAPTT